jgi:hypothetical protein
MPLTLREAHHLVLDRRAVARPSPGDRPRVHRRRVQLAPHQLVGRRAGVGQVAVHLRQQRRRIVVGRHKARRRLLRRLQLDRRIRVVDRPPVEPRRRPRLQPLQREPEPPQVLRQRQRRRLADPPPGRPLRPRMQHPAEEGPRRQHHRRPRDLRAVLQAHPAHTTCPFEQQARDQPADHPHPRIGQQRRLCVRPVAGLVDLHPRRPHRRPLAAVQDPPMDRAGVRGPAHETPERLDLLHQVPLRHPADARVARRLPDRAQAPRHHEHPRPDPRRRKRGLDPCVPRPHHHHDRCFPAHDAADHTTAPVPRGSPPRAPPPPSCTLPACPASCPSSERVPGTPSC